MATITHYFDSAAFIPDATTGAAQSAAVSPTNFPVPFLAFDPAADEIAFTRFVATSYGSGNLTLTILWYADSASSGDVVWSAAIGAITPDTDSQDIETDAFATANTVTDSHLGTTGQRVHAAVITISNLDSIAAGDLVQLKLSRTGSSGSDTMTGDALVVGCTLAYSDT